MLAPRRVPPCFTASVAVLKTFIKLMGPLATPPVDLTALPQGRSREKVISYVERLLRSTLPAAIQ